MRKLNYYMYSTHILYIYILCDIHASTKERYISFLCACVFIRFLCTCAYEFVFFNITTRKKLLCCPSLL